MSQAPGTIPLPDKLPLEATRRRVTTGISIGDYLIRRLQDYGIGHVFGIPGDYVLAFYSMLQESPIQVVGCCREDNAGFAADGYARLNGMGALCVTYCVGGFSTCNSIAGAYAEKSPVVLITGSPGLSERHNNPLLHHKVRDFRTQIEVFEKLCVAGTELNDPLTAFREIDRTLAACARYKRPVYIEIPRDMVKVVPDAPYQYKHEPLASDAEALAEATNEAAAMLTAAKTPVIIAGVEMHRFHLQDKLLRFAEAAQIPITTTLLGKSVIRETHPLYAGLYEGAMGRDEVTQFVEESDCVLMLGTFMTDINLGIYTANLDPGKCVYATSEQLRIRHHHFDNILLGDFLRELTARHIDVPRRQVPPQPQPENECFVPQPDKPITIERMYARVNEALDDKTIIVADVGDALFGATELVARGRTRFLSPAYYTSMGFAVPAALGASFAAPDMRCVVIVGDGAFQMTGMEISTHIANGLAPIVIVLDNNGYGTERYLHSGAFNDIHGWNYARLPEVLGGGTGYDVHTEEDFQQAFSTALADASGLSLLQVHIAEDDVSHSLKRLADRLSKRV